MPISRLQLVLFLVLLTGIGASWVTGRDPAETQPRWPEQDAVFQVAGWSVGPAKIPPRDESRGDPVIVQRTYRQGSGTRAELALWSVPQPHAKTLYRKGADRDFLGEGYTTTAVDPGLIRLGDGEGALIARRGANTWLLIYAYGERRGRLGNGPVAWFWAEFDALLDRPNDYFLARLSLPFKDSEPPYAQARELADGLFPRLTEWYAD